MTGRRAVITRGCLFLGGTLALGGCTRIPQSVSAYVPPTGPTEPWIIAAPNPVPAAGRGPVRTQVNWYTGDGSPGQVYVSVDGGPERLFSNHPLHQEAAIGRGVYEFRLYAGTDHQTRMATVKVTQSRPPHERAGGRPRR
jgi:hypothetical protein